LAKIAVGAGYPAVTDDDILDTIINLPSFQEQQKIAEILQKADRIRRLRRHARQMSETFLQSVFLEMFGRFFRSKTSLLNQVLSTLKT
jgi:type I restriction enzyme, S subunit